MAAIKKQPIRLRGAWRLLAVFGTGYLASKYEVPLEVMQLLMSLF